MSKQDYYHELLEIISCVERKMQFISQKINKIKCQPLKYQERCDKIKDLAIFLPIFLETKKYIFYQDCLSRKSDKYILFQKQSEIIDNLCDDYLNVIEIIKNRFLTTPKIYLLEEFNCIKCKYKHKFYVVGQNDLFLYI